MKQCSRIAQKRKYFPGIVANIGEDKYEVRIMTPLDSNMFKMAESSRLNLVQNNHIVEETVARKLKKLGCLS